MDVHQVILNLGSAIKEGFLEEVDLVWDLKYRGFTLDTLPPLQGEELCW